MMQNHKECFSIIYVFRLEYNISFVLKVIYDLK
jgi:hypothetical protein